MDLADITTIQSLKEYFAGALSRSNDGVYFSPAAIEFDEEIGSRVIQAVQEGDTKEMILQMDLLLETVTVLNQQ